MAPKMTTIMPQVRLRILKTLLKKFQSDVDLYYAKLLLKYYIIHYNILLKSIFLN